MLKRGTGASRTWLQASGASIHEGIAHCRPAWSWMTRLSEG